MQRRCQSWHSRPGGSSFSVSDTSGVCEQCDLSLLFCNISVATITQKNKPFFLKNNFCFYAGGGAPRPLPAPLRGTVVQEAPRAPRAGPRSFNSQLWRIASMASREHDKQCTKCYNPMMARYSPDLISTEHRRNPGRCSSPSTHGCSHTEWGASHPQVHRLGNLGGRRGRATRAYFAGAASSAGGGGGGGGGVFEPWLV